MFGTALRRHSVVGLRKWNLPFSRGGRFSHQPSTRFTPRGVHMKLLHSHGNIDVWVTSLGDENGTHFVHQYIAIRDDHYVHKHKWEPKGGFDQYDAHSVFIILVENSIVVAGCRIINGATIWLPVQEVLRENELPTKQIPANAIEVSRFGIKIDRLELPSWLRSLHRFKTIRRAMRTLPFLLKQRRINRYLNVLADAIHLYADENGYQEAYAVLRELLANHLEKIGVQFEPLPYSSTVKHGRDHFKTVKITGKPRKGNHSAPAFTTPRRAI